MEYTRRDFLKMAGLAGGGLMMSSVAATAQEAKKVNPSEEINLALVGIGAEGEVLLNSLINMPGIRFRAVCDIWKCRRIYARGRIKGVCGQELKDHMYEDYTELLANEKDLDAVIIATPDFWHSPQTVDFLKAGVNVYCEKMMSNTIEGARAMVRAARETGKLLQIGHQRKSNPRYHFVRDVLLRKLNLCGRLTGANAQWNRAVTKDLEVPTLPAFAISDETLQKYGFENKQKFRNWRWYKGLGGGPISDLGAHQIDIFAYMFGGRPKSVMAGGGTEFYNKDWYDDVMCIYEFEKTYQGFPARAFYQVLTTTSVGGYFEQFFGTDGSIKMSENPALTKLFEERGRPELDKKWEEYIKQGLIVKKEMAVAKTADSRESLPPQEYGFDVPFGTIFDKVKKEIIQKPIHMPHLENFFNAIRGKEPLNCDGAHAFEAEAAVYKVNEAVAAGKKLYFKDEDFVA